jgi:hypothetical protein
VTDLTAGDFKVADQGKSQTLLLFRSPVAKNSAELGPHEYTNRPGGLMPHAVAILFDLLNEGDANRLDTGAALRNPSRSSRRPGRYTSTYSVSMENSFPFAPSARGPPRAPLGWEPSTRS